MAKYRNMLASEITPSPYKIQRATLEDVGILQDLHLQLCVYEQQFTPSQSLSFSQSEQGRTYFNTRITSAQSLCLLAKNQESNVGFLIAYLDSQDQTWAKLESVFVIPEMRQKGIGVFLTSNFLEWCAQNDAQRVTVAVASKNIRTLTFYLEHSFYETKRTETTVVLTYKK